MFCFNFNIIFQIYFSIEINLKKDLTFLKKNDSVFFSKNCEKSKVILETSECLNFFGIKLFLIGYLNQNISESELRNFI